MENELTIRQEQTLTPKEIGDQIAAIHAVMKANMRNDHHYGVIPGCGNKPTLLKPGGEMLCLMFRLAPDFEVESLYPGEENVIGYRVICRLRKITTEQFWGSGVGECSSLEDKYKWRKAVCQEEFEAWDSLERRAKWGKSRSGEPYTTLQVRCNAADQANTILKMAKKRALIDAVLTATSASDIFAQDLEDLPEENKGQKKSSPQSAPQADVKEGEWVVGTIKEYVPAKGKVPHKFTFQVGEGVVKCSLFRLPDGWSSEVVRAFLEGNDPVAFQFSLSQDGKFKNLTKLSPYSETEAPSETERKIREQTKTDSPQEQEAQLPLGTK